MNRYKLAEAADKDFETIYEYGIDNYGYKSARQYQDKLTQHFKEIAKHPLHHQAVSHIRKNYRRSVHGPHTVYYRIDETEIVIVRILGRQDPFRALN